MSGAAGEPGRRSAIPLVVPLAEREERSADEEVAEEDEQEHHRHQPEEDGVFEEAGELEDERLHGREVARRAQSRFGVEAPAGGESYNGALSLRRL